jgi:hypothetical protein
MQTHGLCWRSSIIGWLDLDGGDPAGCKLARRTAQSNLSLGRPQARQSVMGLAAVLLLAQPSFSLAGGVVARLAWGWGFALVMSDLDMAVRSMQ